MVWSLLGDSMKEQWREIENYEDYVISDRGRVYSYYTKKFLKPRKGNSGYFTIILYKNGVYKNHTIHRLVALAFIPNPENKRTVNHIDGCKINNFAENLEWNTHAENNKHAFDNGLKDDRGSKHGMSKLTEDQVLEIRRLYKTGDYYQKDLAKMFGIAQSLICFIVNRKIWNHI